MAKTGPKPRLAIERFEEKYIPEPNSGCWIWLAQVNNMTRGVFGFRTVKGVNCRPGLAHRFSYEHYREPIPAGLVLDHLCRNSLCVNPFHLEAVTQMENLHRGIGPELKKIAARLRTHCIHGHDLNIVGFSLHPGSESKACNECGRIRARKWGRNQRGKQRNQATI